MRHRLDRSGMMLLTALSLAACESKAELPMLTFDVVASAAKRCGAKELEFHMSGSGSTPPSFSYLDPGPIASGKPTPASACLAEALKGHRYERMTIRLVPAASPDS